MEAEGPPEPASEDRFRALFEDAPVAYHEIDCEGIVRRVNRAECELLGHTSEEMLGRHIAEFVRPEQREVSREAVRRKASGEQPLEPFRREYVRSDGTSLVVEVHENLIRDERGGVIGIRSTLLDITERTRAEENLRKVHEELEARVEQRTAELARANQALQKEIAERRRVEQGLALEYAVARVLNQSATISAALRGLMEVICESLGWSWAVWWVADREAGTLSLHETCLRHCPETGDAAPDWSWALELAEQARAGGQPRWRVDLPREHAGTALAVPVAGSAIFGVLAFFSPGSMPEDEELLKTTALIGSQLGQFIERKRAEEALHRSEARFAAFMRNLPGVAFMKDTSGHYVYSNPAFAMLLGLAPEQILGRTDEEIFPAETATVCRENDRTVLEGQRALETIEPIPHGDEVQSWLMYKFPILDLDGKPLFLGAVGVDITERKQLEDQLRQSQKMEAIGRLAGGVAHDFNNLLTIISGYGRMAYDELPVEAPARQRIEQVLNASDRAAILTSQLLAFSRRQVVQFKILGLNHVVSNMEKMLRRVIGEHIELETRLDPELAKVKADPGQIEQIIMNLAVNARDAMPEGGKLIIQTSNVWFTKQSDPARLAGRPHVRLLISDTGTGMEAKTKAHLFEPFFTTKERGRGTGLGLSTVYGIVKQHGGEIAVESEPGAGAHFHIYLPQAEASLEPAAPGLSLHSSTRGTETILLAEDETGVRRLAREILRRNGYRVLEADSSQQALRLAEQEPGIIHLLLTDIIMPLMSGRELAERLKVTRNNLKVLYMSGYTDDVIAYHGDLGPGVDFLQKPFAPDALVSKVREALDAPAEV